MYEGNGYEKIIWERNSRNDFGHKKLREKIMKMWIYIIFFPITIDLELADWL